MKRKINMDEISDGKFYMANDLVKADCNDCKGCSACCRGMGQSIALDPLDIHRMTSGLHTTFEQLLAGEVELNVVDGIILPNLKMNGEDEKCAFLNEEGRCGIHSIRPGICRLFPLGRFYENNSFKYFLQVHECKKENKTKVKVKKWVDTPDLKTYETYISDWHYFLLEVQEKLTVIVNDEIVKKIDMFILQYFYLQPYKSEEDFYPQFATRLTEAKKYIANALGKMGDE